VNDRGVLDDGGAREAEVRRRRALAAIVDCVLLSALATTPLLSAVRHVSICDPVIMPLAPSLIHDAVTFDCARATPRAALFTEVMQDA
jgi:hypothetical protein